MRKCLIAIALWVGCASQDPHAIVSPCGSFSSCEAACASDEAKAASSKPLPCNIEPGPGSAVVSCQGFSYDDMKGCCTLDGSGTTYPKFFACTN